MNPDRPTPAVCALPGRSGFYPTFNAIVGMNPDLQTDTGGVRLNFAGSGFNPTSSCLICPWQLLLPEIVESGA